MFSVTDYTTLLVFGSVFILMSLATRQSFTLRSHYLSRLNNILPLFHDSDADSDRVINAVADLVDCHETAARLIELIQKDGAGTWPPRTNYVLSTWPVALRPYIDIYHEMAPMLPQAKPSLDDEVNHTRISHFRSCLAKLLEDRVDIDAVTKLLTDAEAGRWDVFPRDVYNAFYCCVAWHRHAYRWGTIPAVRVAQAEKSLDLPPQLTRPWKFLQANFGLNSDSGNIMSNLTLNFSPSGHYQLRINIGLRDSIQTAEVEFARVLREVEALAPPVYAAIIHSILSYSRGDLEACLSYVQQITKTMRGPLNAYYDKVHNAVIARSEWLSHVQGFYAWGLGYHDEERGEWIKFDGLSGNQVLLFQALDAFLGYDVYLSKEAQMGNVPRLQREFCAAVRRASFRSRLQGDGLERRIQDELAGIVKGLRVFRSAHRSRAKGYLMVPAPERLPMTAGKSLLKATMEESMEFLDSFMVSRLQQTV